MSDAGTTAGRRPRRVGVAADHGGFHLKQQLMARLYPAGFTVVDFGAYEVEPADDYPDYVVPLARAVAGGEIDRGVALCSSGVGASVAANKIAGVRAALVADMYSAHQGVEDDDLNVLCLGARVVGVELAWDLVRTFLSARFAGEKRFVRRLRKIAEVEAERG
jgi:ribose 5-phosphate isomerase B